jgi:hypothetical protein
MPGVGGGAADSYRVNSNDQLIGNGTLENPVELAGWLEATLGVAEDQSGVDGTLEIDGDLTMEPTAKTAVRLSADGFSNIDSNGSVSVAGTLYVIVEGGFVSIAETSFPIIVQNAPGGGFFGGGGSPLTGNFSNVVIIGGEGRSISTSLSYESDRVLLNIQTDAAVQNYNDWLQDYFTAEELSDPLISGVDADPDGDTIENIWEYIFGFSPIEKDSRFPVEFDVVHDEGLIFPRFTIDVSPDAMGYSLDIRRIGSLLDVQNSSLIQSEVSTSGDLKTSWVLGSSGESSSSAFYTLEASLD